jgi:hypothetical protein
MPRTAAADDRARLRAAVGRIALGLLGFVAGCMLVRWSLNAWAPVPSMPEPFRSKYEACLGAAQPFDTVFIGSSRFYHQIDPARFDALMAAKGTPTRSFNLGFDALGFTEAWFLAERVLADPRSRVKRLIVEPVLRARMDEDLLTHQRMIAWHGPRESAFIAEFIAGSDHDPARKAYWAKLHAEAAALNLTNTGAATARFVRDAEPPPDLAGMLGPNGDGFSALPREPGKAQAVADERIPALIAQQRRREAAGSARRPSDFEVELLHRLQRMAAERGVRLELVGAPTALPEIYDELRGVARAHAEGRLQVPTHIFADAEGRPELYRADGFRDADHIFADVSAVFTALVADAIAGD